MKHTPGPWAIHKVDVNYKTHFYRLEGNTQAKVFGHGAIIGNLDLNDHYMHDGITDSEGQNFCSLSTLPAEANAKLIAAAPDLLEACIEFCRKVELGVAKSTRSYQQMKDAINKATT